MVSKKNLRILTKKLIFVLKQKVFIISSNFVINLENIFFFIVTFANFKTRRRQEINDDRY